MDSVLVSYVGCSNSLGCRDWLQAAGVSVVGSGVQSPAIVAAGVLMLRGISGQVCKCIGCWEDYLVGQPGLIVVVLKPLVCGWRTYPTSELAAAVVTVVMQVWQAQMATVQVFLRPQVRVACQQL
jgi:hypothetical protein